MIPKRKKRSRSLERRRARAGLFFILPWLIGFLVFRAALNQAYEGGTGYGNTKRFISEQG